MPAFECASYNLFGITGRSVAQSVGLTMDWLGRDNEELVGVGFQEVWKRAQLAELRDVVLGEGSVRTTRSRVDVWCCPHGGPFRLLVPRLPRVLSLELSSGLVTCVRGTVRDVFFQRYRGGAIPDRFANKGILATLISHRQRLYAVVNTHMHDSKNDGFGGQRGYQLEQLANALHWIEARWVGAELVLVGDFNIDTIEAFARTNRVTTTLFAKMLRAGRGQRAGLLDLNSQQHMPPLRTTPDDQLCQAIDHHLLAPVEGRKLLSFTTAHFGSDHLLTRSRWEQA